MKKCFIFLVLLSFSHASFSQARLHTLGARLFPIWEEQTLCIDTIFGQNSQSNGGTNTISGYYSTDKCEGFSLNEHDNSIQYTSFDWKRDKILNKLTAENISTVKLVLGEPVFNAINDMIDLAVNTSSPQMMHYMPGDPDNYFAYGYDIANYETGDYGLVEVSQNICNAVKHNDINAINALYHDIKRIGDQYKSLYEISECSYDGQPHVYVGSIYERVYVFVRFEDMNSIARDFYESNIATIRRVAEYLLYHTDHQICLNISVGSNPKACTKNSREWISLWCHPSDYSFDNIISVLDDLLITKR